MPVNMQKKVTHLYIDTITCDENREKKLTFSSVRVCLFIVLYIGTYVYAWIRKMCVYIGTIYVNMYRVFYLFFKETHSIRQ